MVRALKIDLGCSPVPGLFAGAASGSVSIGLLVASGWIVVTFAPLVLLARAHFVRNLAGNPERFKPPRWLAQQGVSWAIAGAHFQPVPVQALFRGFLAVEEKELRFIPARNFGSPRLVGSVAQPVHVFAREIASIEAAVPPHSYAIGSLPHLRLVTSESKVEWFWTEGCTAYEAAEKLTALLGIR
jgi:hypothetical protein